MKKDFFALAKVTIRKQIAIPKKVQDKLGGVEEGEYILFYEENGRIYIRKGKIKPL
ncbi:AbrB/MazE/SpoVT family DNA-binding domain-containing protein [Candidatus Aciduliprofundum boonei]|uniref:Transcriptional regulator, AbrB family n=1 Tax=Aciduliprofundum boonei (strain DSM 19572 / T469) TaxID=439481 RepID=B5I9G0_ACIB4|nr:AbrB/MazE/SpoVT family DNA-binding domain-containing protein [Candidatus Aciduliprofundum boonei]ADD08571.1 transcriptional regulator, AbrB family [Aciduliprofundum boonei T469]EDY36777.1 transcriptional regulator, AbrB family, putative [Aciduliprofundum boonei T469]HII55752.1 AbrB/MazE/SpoVT family DNA-binding domain-containing protein [Candidatus Aciduliprofundum boonei]